MADYTNSKFANGSMYPVDAVDSDQFGRYEPLIEPTLLRQRYLLGLPTDSFFVNKITGKPDRITDPIIEDQIKLAVSDVENILRIDIFPVKRKERHAFDRNHFLSFGYLRTSHMPISSVDQLSIQMANQTNVYVMNNDWIDPGGFKKGRIYMIPLTVASSGSGGAAIVSSDSTGSGALFLSLLGSNPWIPAFFLLQYTTGFPDGRIPIVINELIGMTAAIRIMNLIYGVLLFPSYSISIDAMSQSQSMNPSILAQRIEGLTKERDDLAKSLRGVFGTQFRFDTL